MNQAIYLIYILLLLLLAAGARIYGRGKWNEEWLSLRQTKMLQGFMAVLIMFHHMGQKTCAPWHAQRFVVHGLDPFVPVGYLFVGVFLFFSGFGLYKSVQDKPDYLKGFPRRRILPVVMAFYLSEWLFLIVRAVMGEKMDWKQILWYVTGAQLANSNAWYVIALPFFYLFFYAAFRLCRKDGWRLTVTSLLILGYITLGTLVDHNDWWLRGEWWYNTAHCFVLGMLFARFEQPLKRTAQRHWGLWLVLAAAGTVAFFFLSEHALDVLSYYGENWNAPDKVLRRWGCLGTQALASTSFVITVLLLELKVRIGNRVLAFLGGMTLEIYLVHGLFVDLFGYDFLEVRPSLVYIRNVPLYVLAVLICSIPAAVLFRLALRFAGRLTAVRGNPAGQEKRMPAAFRPGKSDPGVSVRKENEQRAASGAGYVGKRKNVRKRSAASSVKHLAILGVGVIGLAAILSSVYTHVLQPGSQYWAAKQLRASGKYDEAAAAFAELGLFHDAALQVTETCYQQAMQRNARGDLAGAAAILLHLKGYKDVDEMIANHPALALAVETAAERDRAFSVGRYVTFGAYPQMEEDQTPIEWLVLARERQKALLISRYALDSQPYNSSYGNTEWKTCSLRKWLNESFADAAFTPEERSALLDTAVDNSSRQGYFSTGEGTETKDRVFLLSYAEAFQYFESDGDRICQPTVYAIKRGANADEKGGCRWMLRSPGSATVSVCHVDEAGKRSANYVHENGCAVRPAVWVDLGAECF